MQFSCLRSSGVPSSFVCIIRHLITLSESFYRPPSRSPPPSTLPDPDNLHILYTVSLSPHPLHGSSTFVVSPTSIPISDLSALLNLTDRVPSAFPPVAFNSLILARVYSYCGKRNISSTTVIDQRLFFPLVISFLRYSERPTEYFDVLYMKKKKNNTRLIAPSPPRNVSVVVSGGDNEHRKRIPLKSE